MDEDREEGSEDGATAPLTDAQRSVWVAQRLDPSSPGYHESVLWRIDGPLDVPALRAAIVAATLRQPVLRTRYVQAPGEPPQQRVDAEPRVEFEHVVLHTTPEAEDDELREAVAARALRPFDLAAGAPIRWTVFDLGPALDAIGAGAVVEQRQQTRIAGRSAEVGVLVVESAIEHTDDDAGAVVGLRQSASALVHGQHAGAPAAGIEERRRTSRQLEIADLFECRDVAHARQWNPRGGDVFDHGEDLDATGFQLARRLRSVESHEDHRLRLRAPRVTQHRERRTRVEHELEWVAFGARDRGSSRRFGALDHQPQRGVELRIECVGFDSGKSRERHGSAPGFSARAGEQDRGRDGRKRRGDPMAESKGCHGVCLLR